EIRRAQRAVAVVLLVGLCGVSGCGGPTGGDNKPWASREEAELNTAAKEAADAANAATTVANQRWQATVDTWAKLVAAPTGSVDGEVQRAETEIRDRLRGVVTEAVLADRLAKDAEDQRAKLAEEKAKLERLESGARWRSVAVAAFRSAVAVALF